MSPNHRPEAHSPSSVLSTFITVFSVTVSGSRRPGSLSFPSWGSVSVTGRCGILPNYGNGRQSNWSSVVFGYLVGFCLSGLIAEKRTREKKETRHGRQCLGKYEKGRRDIAGMKKEEEKVIVIKGYQFLFRVVARSRSLFPILTFWESDISVCPL